MAISYTLFPIRNQTSTSLYTCLAINNIDIVKSGTFDWDKSVTVGTAIKHYPYLLQGRWKTWTTDRGQKIVDFTAPLNLDRISTSPTARKEFPSEAKYAQDYLQSHPGTAHNVYLCIQFIILVDKSFKLHYMGIWKGEEELSNFAPFSNAEVLKHIYLGIPIVPYD